MRFWCMAIYSYQLNKYVKIYSTNESELFGIGFSPTSKMLGRVSTLESTSYLHP